ncbi:MAG: MarR family winged helix-turn-helix transcriptional regulator [Oscillospiraceae bacterium]
MELQQLTEQMLLAVTSLNRSCIPQSVQEPLKGENFLLDYLSAQNGCSTPGTLREVLGVSAPRTAAMLRALEEKGMLRRCADSHDRRRVVVQLTELGRRTAEQMHAVLCVHVQHVLKQLGEQDSRELIRLLGRITEIEADT